MISRVNMVIVGAHAVMANGGVIALVGMNMVALAAQRHSVPFVVLAEVHNLCPLYPHNPEVLLNELNSPSELLDFGEFSDCLDFGSGTGSPLIHVVNPAFDYVPPNLLKMVELKDQLELKNKQLNSIVANTSQVKRLQEDLRLSLSMALKEKFELEGERDRITRQSEKILQRVKLLEQQILDSHEQYIKNTQVIHSLLFA
ncbi:hypothetical protein ACS0TY_004995 [Phlomoides rotata]